MVDRVESIAAGHATVAVRRRARLRAAAFRYRRQPGRVLGHPRPAGGRARAGRRGVKHVNDLAGADWERLRGELHSQRMLGMALNAAATSPTGSGRRLGEALRAGQLRDQPGDRAGSTTTRSPPRRASSVRPVLVGGYSAYPRPHPNFADPARDREDEVGATFMVDMAHFAGLVAGGVLTGDLNPVLHA